MAQSSGNVLAALKRQASMGAPATGGAGGHVLPIVDSAGLTLSRGEIVSARRTANQIRRIGRLGAKTVGGSYTTELLPGGAIDLLFESIARGTYEAAASVPAISDTTLVQRVANPENPIYHAYTIEQLDADIDESELFFDTRLTQLALSLRPNAMATAEWTFSGLDRNIQDPPSTPYFTDPTELTGESLVADDSWIQYQGQDIATITGLDLTFAIASALQPVIGSIVSPDVFMNDMAITGSMTAVRESLDALRDFDAETLFSVKVVLRAPGTGAVPTIGIVLPAVKIFGIDAPFLGGDAAKVETRNLQIGPDANGLAVEFYTSTDVPVAVP